MQAHIQDRLVILINGKIVLAPVILEAITKGPVQIRFGMGDDEGIEEIKKLFQN